MVTIGLMLNGSTLLMILTVFLLLVNFCQLLTWKIWFQPIERIFHEKMDPNSADIEFFFFKLPDLYDKFQLDSQNTEQFYFLLLSYLVCYQIWLNYFENDHHFGYHKILKRSWVQTKWRAGEIPAGSLLLGLTWGLRQQLVSRVCCCVPKKI